MWQAHYMIVVEHDGELYLVYTIFNASAGKKLLTVRRLSSESLPRECWFDEILTPGLPPDTNFNR
jgi:hypothetical protein